LQRLAPLLDVACLTTVALVTANIFPNRFLAVMLIMLPTFAPTTLVARFFLLRGLRWIGVRCLSFYLIHCVILMALFSIMPSVTILIRSVIGFALTLIYAKLSYDYFERPSLRFAENLVSLINERAGHLEAPTESEWKISI
jgi:peptidoglycan/LPS O-acetylase OafA/YrhL